MQFLKNLFDRWVVVYVNSDGSFELVERGFVTKRSAENAARDYGFWSSVNDGRVVDVYTVARSREWS